jgi:hypothetical protein
MGMGKAVGALVVLTVIFIVFVGYSAYNNVESEVESCGRILYVVPEYPHGLNPDVETTGNVPPVSVSFLIQDERTAEIYRIRSYQVKLIHSFGNGDKVIFFGIPNGTCKESEKFRKYTILPITNLTWAGIVKKIMPEKLKTVEAGQNNI